MPRFSYSAINESGEAINDVLEAESVEMANNALLARGYIPTRVSAVGGTSSGFTWRLIMERLTPIRAAELILFTKQFRTMLRAGVSIMNLLQILEAQTDNPNMKKIIRSMTQDIQEGASLYNVFRKYPRAFNQLYCGMVQAGESSGALPEVLDRLIYIIDHEQKVKSDIKTALQYPMIVLTFLLIAFVVLLTFVIPKFVNIFVSAGLTLPLPTKICMILYQFLAAYWYLILGGVVAGIVTLRYYFNTEQGRYIRDAYMMKLPIIGPLYLKAAMSRFASIFAILQSSGVGVLDSMKILSKTIGNAAISREFELINERLEEGRGIAAPLRSAKFFTPIVTNMVAIGEETGHLDEMLNEISEHYDVELEYAMKKLSDAIGPVLTISLAAVVGFFALAIFLPMWDLVGIVK
ncbi:MAG: type II secretion system F family protein [Deltaproteobacteria bacterium]|nr:type II secretion system F family protein [Deltaproteobacteria bacterium]